MPLKQDLSKRKKRKNLASRLYPKCREGYAASTNPPIQLGKGTNELLWGYSNCSVLKVGLKKYADKSSCQIAKFYNFLKNPLVQAYEGFFRETEVVPCKKNSFCTITSAIRTLIISHIGEVFQISHFSFSDSKNPLFQAVLKTHTNHWRKTHE